jgi:hypothetical protein
MSIAPPRPAAPTPRKGVVAAVLVAGIVIVWLATGGRGALRELLLLIGFAMVAFVALRAAWRWWKRHALAMSRLGLLVAFGAAAAGWLTVALLQRLSHVSSENFIWIVMWPLMMLLGLAAGLGGLLGIGMGTAVCFTAPPEPRWRRILIIAGGIVSAILNLWHLERLVRLLLTG